MKKPFILASVLLSLVILASVLTSLGCQAAKAQRTKPAQAPVATSRANEFFTYGFWGGDQSHYQGGWDGLVRDMKNMCMNVLICSPGAGNMPKLSPLLEKHQIYVVPSVGSDIENIRKTVTPVKDDPMVLGWYIRDEPPAQWLPEFLKVSEVLKEISPTKPAMCLFYMPDAAIAFAKHQPLVLTDNYPLGYMHNGTSLGPHFAHHHKNDPLTLKDGMSRYSTWGNRGILEWMDLIQAHTGRPHWITLQVFESGNGKAVRWRLPTRSDIRLQIYYALAGGAKGINFFRYRCFVDEFAVPIDGLHGEGGRVYDEIKRMGEIITPMGPLFVDAQVTEPVKVLAAMRPTRDAGKGIEYRRLRSKTRDIDYLVIFNNDVLVRGSADICLTKELIKGRKIYDVSQLAPVNAKAIATGQKLSLQLKPGGGKIIALASDKDIAWIKSTVNQGKQRNENAVFNIELELTAKSKLDISKVEPICKKVQEAIDAKSFTKALSLTRQARLTLDAVMLADSTFRQTRQDLEAIRLLLSKNRGLSKRLKGVYRGLLKRFRDGDTKQIAKAVATVRKMINDIRVEMAGGKTVEDIKLDEKKLLTLEAVAGIEK